MSLNWIKLDMNILDDNKIKIIRKFPAGNDLFVLWIGLLCLAMKSDKAGYIYITQGIPYTIQDLSNELNIEMKTVEMGLQVFQQYQMIDLLEGGVIEVINFNKHQSLDKILHQKEMTKKRVQNYRHKQKLLLGNADVTSNNAVTNAIVPNSNATDKIRLDKSRIDKNNKPEKILFRPNIKLTQDEFNKLQTEYPKDIEKILTYLSDYKIEKKYKTESDYLTIRRWVIDAVTKKSWNKQDEKTIIPPLDPKYLISEEEIYHAKPDDYTSK